MRNSQSSFERAYGAQRQTPSSRRVDRTMTVSLQAPSKHLGGLWMLCVTICLSAVAGAQQCRAEEEDAPAKETQPSPSTPYFAIRVVDDQTGRGVPLVELKTVHNISYWTDSAGLIAFQEPGLAGQQVFFHVRSHGYEYPADRFEYRGVRLTIEPGKTATVKLQRLNIAERLYRITGAGIYRDSLLLGETPPTRNPVLNGQVFGSDSVVNAVYQGEIYWFWGDTNRPQYPLGNFHVPGATSALPSTARRVSPSTSARSGVALDPSAGIDLKYFVGEDGFARPTCQMPGTGPTWIDGLIVLHDAQGRERMFAKYVKVKPPMTVYERGLVEFEGESRQFQKRVTFPDDAVLLPSGHPFVHRDAGVEYVYFPKPYPHVRVRATPDAIQDLTQYESYSYFTTGSTKEQYELDRDEQGRLRQSWKQDTLAPDLKLEEELVKTGRLTNEERVFKLQDAATGNAIRVHGTSIAWNDYRQRWVMIVLELFGSSPLGEIWYAESVAPEGPWTLARKVVTHENYSFYNPKQHPMLAQDGGRVIYFEGTYTTMFSGNKNPTPRYNYNQIMYRLDLSDPRLALTGSGNPASSR